MYNSFIQDSPELGLSLTSGKHKIKWTRCHDLPVAMYFAYATIIDDVIYISGGVCPDHNDMHYIFMYHLKENRWTRLQTRLPQYSGAVVNINNKLTVIGGKVSTTNRPTNKVLTLQDHHWTSLYGDMNSARYRPLVTSHLLYTIVAGGQDHDYLVLDTIEMFNISTNQWTISKTCLPKPMWWISATTCNNSLIITGYNSIDGRQYNGVYITTMNNIIDHSTTSSSANKWTPLAPTPYWNTTIIPHTTPPIIVGGEDQQHNPTDDIMAYDDSTNSWRTVSSLPIKCCSTTILKLPHTIIMAGGATYYRTRETRNATSVTSVMIGELVEYDNIFY